MSVHPQSAIMCSMHDCNRKTRNFTEVYCDLLIRWKCPECMGFPITLNSSPIPENNYTRCKDCDCYFKVIETYWGIYPRCFVCRD